MNDLIDLMVIFVAFLIPVVGFMIGNMHASPNRTMHRWACLAGYYALVASAFLFVLKWRLPYFAGNVMGLRTILRWTALALWIIAPAAGHMGADLDTGPDKRCKKCGYDLRASRHHCPECGEVISTVVDSIPRI